ncbi:hypothetical protein J7E81_08585 [Bacillus sp. ISL-18]|uniref:hypothetical protein n=1 Tax=Bacillus sp. ISL-18 TaxID=2819118 RepID=UPI001BEBCBA9|nr:hypothetical protein [Bacillus sp. ISL-18]MBT2655297.1 hypothetical protein [Bacillus sp. ISL-18]
MQKKEYIKAYELLEISRMEGSVLIVPYTLVLLVTSQYDKVKDFFEMHAENIGLGPSARKVLESLVSFDGAHPVAIENIILEQYSMEIYFKDPSSSEKLQEEIRTAIHALSEHPSFFQLTGFQWGRKYLQDFSLDKPVWFTGIDSIFSVLKYEIHELFSMMLPSGVKQTFHHDSPHLQYVVFKDEKMKLGFHKSVICEDNFFQFHFRILSLKELQEMNLLIPLESSFQLAPKDIQWQIERIMYEWTENGTKKLYWLEHVVPLIENIPSDYQSFLDGIKRYYELRLPF